jgi:WD40 repeat protein
MLLQSGARLYVGLVAISIAATIARGQEWKKPSEGGRGILSIHTASWGVSNLALRPDGKRIVSSNAGFPTPIDHKAYLVLNDAATGKRFGTITAPDASIFTWGLAFRPDGRQFAASYSKHEPSSSVIIWDAETHKQLLEFKIPLPVVTSLAFTPDGKHIITGGGDNHMYATIRPPGELKASSRFIVKVPQNVNDPAFGQLLFQLPQAHRRYLVAADAQHS